MKILDYGLDEPTFMIGTVAPTVPEGSRYVVVLASSFYTAALERPLEAELAKHLHNDSVISVPYNQLNSFLLSPGLVVPEDSAARVILLLRVEDFIRLELMEHGKNSAFDAGYCLSALRAREAEFLDILSQMKQLRLTAMICPAGRGACDSTFLGNAVRVSEFKIAAMLKRQQRHLVMNWSDFEQFAPRGDLFNPAGDRLGHVPFSPEGLAALAEFFATRLNQVPTVTLADSSGRSDTINFETFLASLRVETTITPMTSESAETVTGLVRHTTHFITHPADKSRPGQFFASGSTDLKGEAWCITVDDRFGHYGVSGAVLFRVDDKVMRISFLFLTCPVLGRQVEHALVHWLAEVAEQRNVEFIQVSIVNGRDNKILAQFLSKLAAEGIHGDDSNSQVDDSRSQFLMHVAGLKDCVSKIAPNPAALSGIITRMTHGEARPC